MNGITRFFKLMFIKDRELFVLAGDIDTYIYLLFLKGCIYFMLILAIVDCGVLIPIYYNGTVNTDYT